MKKGFTKVHLWVFMGILAVATVFNFFVVNEGIDHGPEHTRQVIVTTLATVTGPMTGGIARDLQSCCVKFSLWVLLVFSGPALLVGIIMQLIPLPFQKGARVFRMFFWVASLLLWFLGGLISYGHALE
jgi:hypothetical protein